MSDGFGSIFESGVLGACDSGALSGGVSIPDTISETFQFAILSGALGSAVTGALSCGSTVTIGGGDTNSGTGFGDGSITGSTRGAGPGMELAASPRDEGWRFGSYHLGLCQFVFGDGSVRSLTISIAPTTLALLASINDGEPIPDY